MSVNGIGSSGNREIPDVEIPDVEVPDAPETQQEEAPAPEFSDGILAAGSDAAERYYQQQALNPRLDGGDDGMPRDERSTRDGGYRVVPGVTGMVPSSSASATTPATAATTTNPTGQTLTPQQVRQKFEEMFKNAPLMTEADSRAILTQFKAEMEPYGIKIEAIEHPRLDNMLITYPNGMQQAVDFIYAKYSDAEIASGKADHGVQKLQWLVSNPNGPDSPNAPRGAGGNFDTTFLMSWLGRYPPTKMREAIKDLQDEMRRQGIKGWDRVHIVDHPKGDIVDLGNGRRFDAVQNAGAPNAEVKFVGWV